MSHKRADEIHYFPGNDGSNSDKPIDDTMVLPVFDDVDHELVGRLIKLDEALTLPASTELEAIRRRWEINTAGAAIDSIAKVMKSRQGR